MVATTRPGGDAAKITLAMQEPQYEPAPRPAPPWATPAVITVLALLAVYVVLNYRPDAPEPLTQAAVAQAEQPPATLADGSPVPEIPQSLANRFAEPVVLTRRVDDPPARVATTCNAVPFGNPDEDPAARRLEQLIEQADPVDVRVSPEALTYLLIGSASTPPSYPENYQASCLSRYVDGQWDEPVRWLGFASDGGRAAGAREQGIESQLVRVPPRAAWIVQQRPGWWLAHDVAGTPWVQLPVRPGDGEPGSRTVFLDDDGTVLADRPLLEAPEVQEETSGQQSTLVAGDVQEILADLREYGPRYFCADEADACVWLSLVGNEIVAVSAFGPYSLDVPPFGYVGYCPSTDAFEGSTTTSRFNLDGTWANGPANRGLAQYGVRIANENIVVDLDQRQLGDVPEDTEGTGSDGACVFDGGPVGIAPDEGPGQDADAES